MTEYLNSISEPMEKTVFSYRAGESFPYEGKVFFRQDTSLQIRYLYTWDAKGWITEIKIFRKNAQSSVYQPVNYFYRCSSSRQQGGNSCKLTYDARGNWVRAIVYKNDSPAFIVERVVEYYHD